MDQLFQTTSETDARLVRVLDEYFAALQSGTAPSKHELLARHPDLAEELTTCLGSLDFIRLAGVKASPQELAGPTVEPQAPTGVLGDYRIIREIGRGGMGVVYEAEQISLGRRVALKVLPFAAVLDPKHLQRFKNEAHLAAQLHHTHIVPVYAVGCERGVHFYAMQHIEGQTIAAVVRELRQLAGRDGSDEEGSRIDDRGLSIEDRPAEQASKLDSPSSDLHPRSSTVIAGITTEQPGRTPAFYRTVANLGQQAAEAIEYAHETGVIHRDIKPSNLLLDAKGKIWITDFGLAQVQTDAGLTMTGDLLGTVRYMSPEQALAKRVPVDQRTDIYSLGVTLYELLTLEPAFPGNDRHDLMRRIAFDDPAAPRRIDKAIPPELETIVLKAMAKNPSSRYATAQEVSDDLKRFLEDKPIRARRPGVFERMIKFARRHRAAVWSAIAVLCVLAVGSFVSTLLLSRAYREATANLIAANNARSRAEQEESLAKTLRDRAEKAEREKTQELWKSCVAQAHAGLRSRSVGQRFDTLEAIARAARLSGELQLDEAQRLTLRNDAIKTLAVPDLKLARRFAVPVADASGRVHRDLKRYVAFQFDDAGTIVVFAGDGNQELCRLPGPGVRCGEVSFSADGRRLAAWYSQPQECRLWDLDRQEVLLTRPVNASWSWTCPASPDGNSFAIPEADGVHIYEFASGRELRMLPTGPVYYALAFRPDGRQLAVQPQSAREIQLWDLQSGGKIRSVALPDWTFDVAWGADGKLLAVGGVNDHVVRIFEADSGREHASLRGHQSTTYHLRFHPSGDYLATASWDGTSRLWDTATGLELLVHPDAFMEFTPDGRHCTTISGGEISIWAVESPRECRTFPTYARPGGVYHVADFSPDGRLLATACVDGLRIWDLAARRELGVAEIGYTLSAMFDPMGNFLLTSGNRGLHRWPITTPDRQTVRFGPPELLARATDEGRTSDLTPDGRLASFVAGRSHAVVLDLDTPEKQLSLDDDSMEHAAIHPAGKWVVTSTHWGRGLKLWNGATGELVSDLWPRQADMNSNAAFSRDGKWCVASSGTEIRFYDVATWRIVRTIRREWDDSPSPIAFSPDGAVVAVSTSRSAVHLMELETGRELATVESPDFAHVNFSFSRDGSQMAASSEHFVRVWDLRLIRQRLAEIGLDWDRPAFAESTLPVDGTPVRLELIDMGTLKREAREYRNNQQYRQAIAIYEQILKIDPDDADTLNRLAWVLAIGPADVRDPERALALSQRSNQLSPNSNLSLNTLGVVYYRLGRYDDAIRTLASAGRADVAEPTALDLFFLAMCHHRLGDAAQAKSCFDRALVWIAAHPDMPPHWPAELAAFRAEAEALMSRE